MGNHLSPCPSNKVLVLVPQPPVVSKGNAPAVEMAAWKTCRSVVSGAFSPPTWMLEQVILLGPFLGESLVFYEFPLQNYNFYHSLLEICFRI